jgi:hypothetical protein
MEKNANGKLKHGCSQGRGLVGPFFLEGGGEGVKVGGGVRVGGGEGR